jgi:hypothetical protein
MLVPKPHVVSSPVSGRRDPVALSILLLLAVLVLFAPRSSGGDPKAAKPELSAEEEIAALLTATGIEHWMRGEES